MRRISLGCFILMFASAIPMFVHGADGRQVENPYQEEFDYELGERLELDVQIGALVLNSLRVVAGNQDDIEAGKTVKAFVYLELENPSDSSASIDTILLLEDEQGIQLERVELKSVKVSSGDAKEDDQKVKLDGRTLRDLGKIYLYAEVN
jgi:hypothetical protein